LTKDPALARTAAAWNELNTTSDSAYWMHIPGVTELVNRKVNGSPTLAWYTRQVEQRATPFGRVLAFGDGYGMAAEAIQTRRDTTEVVYLNVCPGEERRFRDVMSLVRADIPLQFVQADANAFPFETLGTFDTIIDVGAFHHFRRLGPIFAQLNRALRPEGRLYVDEYVGPSRYHFGRAAMRHVNRILRELPAELVRSRQSVRRRDYLDLWRRGPDPSEGIRSTQLDRALHRHFTPLEILPYGGTVLQPLFLATLLDPPRLDIAAWHRQPAGRETAVRLWDEEEQEIARGALRSDYAFYVLTWR